MRTGARLELLAHGLALAVVVAGCGNGGGGAPSSSASSGPVLAPKGRVLEAAENEAHAASSSSARAAEAATVPIPAGKLVAGSTPGDRGRDPTLEPPLLELELEAFDIDRLPYPNELGKPPLVGVSRERAQAACAERGRRLCSELEWERACKGPDDQPFAGRAAWDRACSEASSSCASGFGVLAMGSLREWTASDVPALGDVAAGAAVRGAAPDAADVAHRCAHRSSVEPGSSSKDLGFRCCGGPPNPATIPSPKKQPTFERAELAPEQLAEMLSSTKQLRSLGTKVEYFDPTAAPKHVVERGDAGEPKGYELTTAPLLWRPVLGEELVVVTARSGDDALVVALYRLPDERYRLASSLVLHGEKGPVVLAYDRSVDRRLEWSTCWGCPGESGRITFRDDGRVVITQE